MGNSKSRLMTKWDFSGCKPTVKFHNMRCVLCLESNVTSLPLYSHLVLYINEYGAMRKNHLLYTYGSTGMLYNIYLITICIKKTIQFFVWINNIFFYIIEIKPCTLYYITYYNNNQSDQEANNNYRLVRN